MKSGRKSSAFRRYKTRSVTTMLLYVLSLAITSIGFDHFRLTGLAVYLLAILPALPILVAMVVVGLYLAEEKDEFVRSFWLEAMLWGIGPTMALTTVWGSLTKFAHLWGMDLFLVYPIYCVFVFIATAVLKRKYR